MLGSLAHPLARIAAATVLLTGILGWMVVDRVRLLASGREIVLPIRPVDPRDLLKGDYARLGFDISTVDPAMMPAAPPLPSNVVYQRQPPRTVYVTLEQQPDQSWITVAVALRFPTAHAANQIVLRGTTQSWDQRLISYGIERYFVPEGTGGRIEDLARTSRLSAIVAVDRSGRAAIKGLVSDGRRIYEEPLF